MDAILLIVAAAVVIFSIIGLGNYLVCLPLVRAGYRPFPTVSRGRPVLDAREPATAYPVSVLNGLPTVPLRATSVTITRDAIEEDDPFRAFRIERAEVERAQFVHVALQGWFVVFQGPSGRYRSLGLQTGDMEGLASDLDAFGWPVARPRLPGS